MPVDQRMRTGTRKLNEVGTRLSSKSTEGYQSQRLWSHIPRKSMTQKPGKVPKVGRIGFRNSLLELPAQNQPDSLFSVSLESGLSQGGPRSEYLSSHSDKLYAAREMLFLNQSPLTLL